MTLPQAFIERTKSLLNGDYATFEAALQTESPTSIRLNSAKTPATFTPPTERVAWCETGYYLPERPIFTLDPLFHAGAYYVQEASSMFVEQAVRQHIKEPCLMLDLCAAPGGKSTHLASLLPAGSLLVSNEYLRSRAYILAENLCKWGLSHTLVCNNAPTDFGNLPAMFDAALVDAPCSGEGLFRKTPKAIDEWSPANVENCVARQREILSQTWNCLKANALLIYSSCTYNRAENEENVQWIIRELGAERLQIALNPDWNITETDFGYRFFPHKTRGEGFFLSILRKTSDENFSTKLSKKKKAVTILSSNKNLNQYIQKNENYRLVELNGKFYFLPENHADTMLFFAEKMKMLHAGIPAGVWKGKDFVPDAALALSTELNLKNCQTADVDLTTALSFLRTENIVLLDAPRGWVLIRYQGLPLGWVKNLGNRCNSFYPSEWRIRMNIG